MQCTVDVQKSTVRTLQTKLDYEKTHVNTLIDKFAKLERRLRGKPEPGLTPELHKQQLIREAQQAVEVYGKESVLAKAKQKRLDQAIHAEGLQGGRDDIPPAGSNQVLDALNGELAAAQEKIKHVEDALRVKTLQWQELHQNFERLQHRQKETADNVKEHWSLVLSLRDQLLFEKNYSSGLRRDNDRLERKLNGKPALELTQEGRRELLISELERIAEVHGEDCDQYRTKQRQLDRMFDAQHEDGKLKVAEEAKRATEAAEEAKNAKMKSAHES